MNSLKTSCKKSDPQPESNLMPGSEQSASRCSVGNLVTGAGGTLLS